ncbi:phosphoribosylanthranilate isomerase [Halalkalibacillus halophilus]|uniref:phosphoribosylanthranilate isomerase n=1 Tax=Halalkalibacillus halophilus TaxID=392827 RepID=UPI0003F92BE2|nr:phosphoribosylanthranilate isomerase [Halalkalibacillus halophilus]
MTKVKICGIQNTHEAKDAVRAGADLVGFVFAESKRKITPENAQEIAASIPNHVQKVGVFVNESPDAIHKIAEQVPLDYVQLHGDETIEDSSQLKIPFIKVVSLKEELSSETVPLDPLASYHLLDSAKGPYRGGNGTTFNWELISQTNIPLESLMIAGGLNENNIQNLLQRVTPAIVDVSSGVETDGRKDSTKVKQFIKRVKEMKE